MIGTSGAYPQNVKRRTTAVSAIYSMYFIEVYELVVVVGRSRPPPFSVVGLLLGGTGLL